MSKLIKVIDNQTIELISVRNPNVCFNKIDTTYVRDEGIPGELKTSLFKDCEYYCDFKKQINPFELYSDYEKQQQEIDRLNKIINKTLANIEKQKKKMYKSRNKIAMYVLMNIEKELKEEGKNEKI